MKLKPTVLLATFVVTMGLLLGASAAQAATVETDGAGNVTKILGLEVFDDASNSTFFYNVDFVYDTAIKVYSSGEFDFFPAENAVVALAAVNNALNAHDPTPVGAGPQGSDQFFIGAVEYFGRVGAFGGQRFSEIWGNCEGGSESECIFGTAILDPADPFTYAKFTETQDLPPGQATLISPSGAITDNTPTYTWNAVADSTWYNLFVKDNTEEVIIDQWYTAEAAGCGGGTGECSVTPVDMLADGLHQWLIQTWNESGEGPLSNGMSFTVDTTGAPPGPATLISPTGTIIDNTPTYTWNATANSISYRLWANDSTGNNVIDQSYTAEAANCGDGTGECSVTPATVLADDTYEWWIQTLNNFGAGPWSDGLSFTVETIGAEPGPATLISPSGTITDNTPTYTWNAVANATWYYLWVQDMAGNAKDKWYTAEETDCSGGTGECSVTPEFLLADDSYRWWIQTWNDAGFGPWSDELSFTVDTSSGPIVELDEDGNVIGIENLPVLDEKTQETTIYDVDFIYGTVTEVYGSGLDFDFPAPENDENIIIALAAVNNALNAHDPTPVGAGPQGTNHFFIGYKDEDGPIVAAGGEPLAGVWGPCGTAPCFNLGELQFGVAVLSPNDPYTWADFTVVAD